MVDPRSGRSVPARSEPRPASTSTPSTRISCTEAPTRPGVPIGSGSSPAGLPRGVASTDTIARSPEWTGVVVAELYRLALGREPDPAGLAFWRDKVAARRPVAEVAADLFGSPESWALGGGTRCGRRRSDLPTPPRPAA